eukprot:465070_1
MGSTDGNCTIPEKEEIAEGVRVQGILEEKLKGTIRKSSANMQYHTDSAGSDDELGSTTQTFPDDEFMFVPYKSETHPKPDGTGTLIRVGSSPPDKNARWVDINDLKRTSEIKSLEILSTVSANSKSDSRTFKKGEIISVVMLIPPPDKVLGQYTRPDVKVRVEGRNGFSLIYYVPLQNFKMVLEGRNCKIHEPPVEPASTPTSPSSILVHHPPPPSLPTEGTDPVHSSADNPDDTASRHSPEPPRTPPNPPRNPNEQQGPEHLGDGSSATDNTGDPLASTTELNTEEETVSEEQTSPDSNEEQVQQHTEDGSSSPETTEVDTEEEEELSSASNQQQRQQQTDHGSSPTRTPVVGPLASTTVVNTDENNVSVERTSPASNQGGGTASRTTSSTPAATLPVVPSQTTPPTQSSLGGPSQTAATHPSASNKATPTRAANDSCCAQPAQVMAATSIAELESAPAGNDGFIDESGRNAVLIVQIQ